MLFYFIKEMIFDQSEEYKYKSHKFNTRKIVIFLIVLLSVMTNVYFVNKTIILAKEMIDLEIKNNSLIKENASLKAIIEKNNSSRVSSESNKYRKRSLE